eukprot:142795_1
MSTLLIPTTMFDEQDLKNIRLHQYGSIHHDILDPYIFRPYFWTPMARCIPAWISPNAITLVGATFHFLTVMYWIYHTVDLNTCSDSGTYCVMAFGVFVYQFCDNLDGIHARNTNQTSSFGCLLDHGIDAFVNIVFAFFSLAPAAVYGNSDFTFCVAILEIVYEYGINVKVRHRET